MFVLTVLKIESDSYRMRVNFNFGNRVIYARSGGLGKAK